MDLDIILRVISTLITPCITIACFMIIKFNDLRHLEKDVTSHKQETKEKLDKIVKTQDKMLMIMADIDKRVAIQKEHIDLLEKSIRK